MLLGALGLDLSGDLLGSITQCEENHSAAESSDGTESESIQDGSLAGGLDVMLLWLTSTLGRQKQGPDIPLNIDEDSTTCGSCLHGPLRRSRSHAWLIGPRTHVGHA